MMLAACRMSTFCSSFRRQMPQKHGDTETRRCFLKTPVPLSSTRTLKNVLRVSAAPCVFLREQAPLGAAGVGLIISAVAQRRKRELGEHAIPAVAGMEA